MIDRSMDIYSDIWYIHFIGVKRMEFDEEFVILLRREQRGDSVSGLVPTFLSVAGSRRLMGLIRLKYVP